MAAGGSLSDRAFACGLVLAAIAVPFAKHRALFVVIAAWFAVEAIVSGYAGGIFAGTIAPFARAIRWMAPLAIAASIAGDDLRAQRLLTYGTSAVFAGHGLEAMLLNPKFVDYLTVTLEKVAGLSIPLSLAQVALLAIGLVDVSLAILLMRRPSRAVLGYMAFWGLATALMRSVFFGPELGWHHTIVRTLNGGAPLLLLLMRQPMPRAVSEESSVPATAPVT